VKRRLQDLKQLAELKPAGSRVLKVVVL